jgi:1-deoxy-D-xylulose-5-phosphate synthase
MVYRALEVHAGLKKEGRSFTIINARFAKPLDEKLMLELGRKYKVVYTLEDNVVSGGFGSSILELYSSRNIEADVKVIGFDDCFIPHGEKEELFCMKNMDTDSIISAIMKE